MYRSIASPRLSAVRSDVPRVLFTTRSTACTLSSYLDAAGAVAEDRCRNPCCAMLWARRFTAAVRCATRCFVSAGSLCTGNVGAAAAVGSTVAPGPQRGFRDTEPSAVGAWPGGRPAPRGHQRGGDGDIRRHELGGVREEARVGSAVVAPADALQAVAGPAQDPQAHEVGLEACVPLEVGAELAPARLDCECPGAAQGAPQRRPTPGPAGLRRLDCHEDAPTACLLHQASDKAERAEVAHRLEARHANQQLWPIARAARLCARARRRCGSTGTRCRPPRGPSATRSAPVRGQTPPGAPAL